MIKIFSHSTNFGLFERTFVAPCQVTTFSSTKAWIHMGGYGQLISKERKLANNSTISFIFNFWSHDMVQAQENLNIYFWGKKHFVLGLLVRDIANHLYVPNTPLTQALNPLHKHLQVTNLVELYLFVRKPLSITQQLLDIRLK